MNPPICEILDGYRSESNITNPFIELHKKNVSKSSICLCPNARDRNTGTDNAGKYYGYKISLGY